jgi:hypothetical protein
MDTVTPLASEISWRYAIPSRLSSVLSATDIVVSKPTRLGKTAKPIVYSQLTLNDPSILSLSDQILNIVSNTSQRIEDIIPWWSNQRNQASMKLTEASIRFVNDYLPRPTPFEIRNEFLLAELPINSGQENEFRDLSLASTEILSEETRAPTKNIPPMVAVLGESIVTAHEPCLFREQDSSQTIVLDDDLNWKLPLHMLWETSMTIRTNENPSMSMDRYRSHFDLYYANLKSQLILDYSSNIGQPRFGATSGDFQSRIDAAVLSNLSTGVTIPQSLHSVIVPYPIIIIDDISQDSHWLRLDLPFGFQLKRSNKNIPNRFLTTRAQEENTSSLLFDMYHRYLDYRGNVKDWIQPRFRSKIQSKLSSVAGTNGKNNTGYFVFQNSPNDVAVPVVIDMFSGVIYALSDHVLEQDQLGLDFVSSLPYWMLTSPEELVPIETWRRFYAAVNHQVDVLSFALPTRKFIAAWESIHGFITPESIIEEGFEQKPPTLVPPQTSIRVAPVISQRQSTKLTLSPQAPSGRALVTPVLLPTTPPVSPPFLQLEPSLDWQELQTDIRAQNAELQSHRTAIEDVKQNLNELQSRTISMTQQILDAVASQSAERADSQGQQLARTRQVIDTELNEAVGEIRQQILDDQTKQSQAFDLIRSSLQKQLDGFVKSQENYKSDIEQYITDARNALVKEQQQHGRQERQWFDSQNSQIGHVEQILTDGQSRIRQEQQQFNKQQRANLDKLQNQVESQVNQVDHLAANVDQVNMNQRAQFQQLAGRHQQLLDRQGQFENYLATNSQQQMDYLAGQHQTTQQLLTDIDKQQKELLEQVKHFQRLTQAQHYYDKEQRNVQFEETGKIHQRTGDWQQKHAQDMANMQLTLDRQQVQLSALKSAIDQAAQIKSLALQETPKADVTNQQQIRDGRNLVDLTVPFETPRIMPAASRRVFAMPIMRAPTAVVNPELASLTRETPRVSRQENVNMYAPYFYQPQKK